MTASKNCNRLFHFVCLCVTAGLIGRCLQQYLRDEDDTLLEYRKYNTGKGTIYPSISFCIHHPTHLFYTIDVWKQYSDKNNSMMSQEEAYKMRKKYIGFLNGKVGNELLERVDYDTVSPNLGRYLIGFRVALKSNEHIIYRIVNGSFVIWDAYKAIKIGKDVFNRSMFSSQEIDAIANPNLYVSKRGPYQKCFSFDTPFIREKQIKELTLHFDAMLFRGKGIKPDKKQFTIHYHYPHQTLKSFSTLDGWRAKADKVVKNYMRRFYLASLEVIRRRDKHSAPCIAGDYDSTILGSAMRSSGCKHSVIKTNDSYPICNTEKTFMGFEKEWKIKEHPPPCESIQGLYEWHGEGDVKDIKMFCKQNPCGNCGKIHCGKKIKKGEKANSNLIIKILFTNEFYKEIVYSKKYTFEALIGNTGGYVGKK